MPVLLDKERLLSAALHAGVKEIEICEKIPYSGKQKADTSPVMPTRLRLRSANNSAAADWQCIRRWFPPYETRVFCYYAPVEQLYSSLYDSPVGPLTLVASRQGLVALEFGKRKHPEAAEDSSRFATCRQQLNEYFSGKREKFTMALDIRGTEFQKRCWHELLKIPYGQTRSYRQIAEAVGNRNAVRAVGLANGQNPIAIIVPCHRVIASDGTLCGYGGGLPLKEELLRLEGARLF